MIPSKEEVLAVTPAALVGWARRTGWRHRERFRYAEVFAHNGEDETVVLPWKRDIGDYASRVWDAVKIFAAQAETHELFVLRELLAADRDLLNVAVTRQSSRSGNEPGSREILDGVRVLLGRGDGEEDPVWWSSDAVVARRGRFSVSVLAPAEAGSDHDGLPRGRAVPDLMAKLGAARHAVDRFKRDLLPGDPLEPSVATARERGVTADMFRVLREMTLDFGQVAFSMEGGWNVAAEPPANEVVFPSEDSPLLAMAERCLMSGPREAGADGGPAPEGP